MWDILLTLSKLSTNMSEIETYFKEFQTSITLLILNNRAICKHKGKNRKSDCFIGDYFQLSFGLATTIYL